MFPAKPAKLYLDNRQVKRVMSKRLSLERESLDVAENISMGIRAFNNRFKENAEEDEFNGFTDDEIAQAKQLLNQFNTQNYISEEEVLAYREVALDRNKYHADRHIPSKKRRKNPYKKENSSRNKTETLKRKHKRNKNFKKEIKSHDDNLRTCKSVDTEKIVKVKQEI